MELEDDEKFMAEAIKIAEAYEQKFQITRKKVYEFKKLKTNAQHLQCFELSEGPLKRDIDMLLNI